MEPTSTPYGDQAAAQRRLEFALRSPAAFYVSGEDHLQISAICSAANVSVVVAGRVMGFDGVSRPFEERLAPTSNRVITSILRAIGEGWIQQFVAYASAGTPANGQCWVRVQVVRGLTGATQVLGVLASGCVTSQQPLMFPGSPLRGPLDGPGFIRSITGTNPAAGVEFSETVPTAARWRLRGLSVSFATDATVANRWTRLIIDDGTTQLWRGSVDETQTASGTRIISRAQGMPTFTYPESGVPEAGLPDFILLAGYRIRSETGAIVAGDDYGAPQLLVEEWLEGAA